MPSLTFILTSLIVILAPGTGVLYTLSVGLSRGKRDSIYAAIGSTLGILPHMTLGIMALIFFESINTTLFNVVKIAGTLYLLYLGISMFINAQALSIHDPDSNADSDAANTPVKLTFKGILINLLNPKLTLFFLSFLPQFIQPDAPVVHQGLVLSLIFMLITLLVFIPYGLLAGQFRTLIRTSPKGTRITQRILGLLFVGFAIRLFLSKA